VSVENRGKMAAIGMTCVLVCGPDRVQLV
jgi:hypothetical protein